MGQWNRCNRNPDLADFYQLFPPPNGRSISAVFLFILRQKMTDGNNRDGYERWGNTPLKGHHSDFLRENSSRMLQLTGTSEWDKPRPFILVVSSCFDRRISRQCSVPCTCHRNPLATASWKTPTHSQRCCKDPDETAEVQTHHFYPPPPNPWLQHDLSPRPCEDSTDCWHLLKREMENGFLSVFCSLY